MRHQRASNVKKPHNFGRPCRLPVPAAPHRQERSAKKESGERTAWPEPKKQSFDCASFFPPCRQNGNKKKEPGFCTCRLFKAFGVSYPKCKEIDVLCIVQAPPAFGCKQFLGRATVCKHKPVFCRRSFPTLRAVLTPRHPRQASQRLYFPTKSVG